MTELNVLSYRKKSARTLSLLKSKESENKNITSLQPIEWEQRDTEGVPLFQSIIKKSMNVY